MTRSPKTEFVEVFGGVKDGFDFTEREAFDFT